MQMKHILLLLMIPIFSYSQTFLCHKGKWPNCQGEFKKDGDKYYGVFTMKEGQIWSCQDGKYTFLDGTYFEGEWKNGKTWTGNGIMQTEFNEVCEYLMRDGEEVLSQRICNNHNQYYIGDLHGPDKVTVDLFKNEQGNPNAFYMYVVINNQKVKFHFDTGCSTFNMNLSQWENLNLDRSQYEDLRINSFSDAVGSKLPTKYYKILDPIQFDKFSINNVIVSVVQVTTDDDDIENANLLGIGFLKKFSNVTWDMGKNKLVLYK